MCEKLVHKNKQTSNQTKQISRQNQTKNERERERERKRRGGGGEAVNLLRKVSTSNVALRNGCTF